MLNQHSDIQGSDFKPRDSRVLSVTFTASFLIPLQNRNAGQEWLHSQQLDGR